MEKKIVAIIRPFDSFQKLFVFEDGKKIDEAMSSISGIEDVAFSLSQKYDIRQFDIVGIKAFNEKIAKDIREKALIKYNDNEIKINLL